MTINYDFFSPKTSTTPINYANYVLVDINYDFVQIVKKWQEKEAQTPNSKSKSQNNNKNNNNNNKQMSKPCGRYNVPEINEDDVDIGKKNEKIEKKLKKMKQKMLLKLDTLQDDCDKSMENKEKTKQLPKNQKKLSYFGIDC